VWARVARGNLTQVTRLWPSTSAISEAARTLSLSDYTSLLLYMWRFVWGAVWESRYNKVLSSGMTRRTGRSARPRAPIRPA
jgi:hypothetical protein